MIWDCTNSNRAWAAFNGRRSECSWVLLLSFLICGNNLPLRSTTCGNSQGRKVCRLGRCIPSCPRVPFCFVSVTRAKTAREDERLKYRKDARTRTKESTTACQETFVGHVERIRLPIFSNRQKGRSRQHLAGNRKIVTDSCISKNP